jgi:Flp pilus assembly protein TadG
VRARGQTLVEATLSSALLLLFVAGIVDFGRAMYDYNEVAQAAKLGARWASVNTPMAPNDCVTAGGTCQTAIVSYLENKSGLGSANVTPAITFGPSLVPCTTQPDTGCTVNVQVQYLFKWAILPLPAQTFTATSQMVITSQYCDNAATCTPTPL